MSDDSASARWLTVHDEILRGMAHALSNRIATVGAAAYMLENGDVPVEQVLHSLRDESGRMEQLLQLLRVLPQRPGAEAEPATANEACAAAVSLHAHHPDLRDCPCDIEIDAAVYPIWAEPHSFGHALVVALTTAKRNAASGDRVTLRVTGNTDVVHFRAIAGQVVDVNDSLNESDARAAAWLLAPFGGTARLTVTGCELEVPTLLAARKARKS
jgi:signal transduction histidine kinase